MQKPRKVYVNSKWEAFCQRVIHRDKGLCLQCGRGEPEVVLQVHHEVYHDGRAPWDYPLSDCRTLCKGCHAREHGLIEPDRGWRLVAIEDLGGPYAICERHGCGHEIRYAYYTYHPAWGYKLVGSTCIEHLTQADRQLSSKVVGIYKNISHFVHNTPWREARSKRGKRYMAATYKYHEIRIYGEYPKYTFQLVIKEKGVRWHDYGKFISLQDKTLEQAQELAYIALKGTLGESEEEKQLLRGIYKRLC